MTQLYINMPQPGETITQGTIVKWLIKAGDSVQENTPLAELETEKAVFEYESPFEGKIVQVLHGDGERVHVSHPIAIIDSPEEKAAMYVMMGIGKRVDGAASTSSSSNSASPSAPSPNLQTNVSEPSRGGRGGASDSVKLSPVVRRLAEEHGLSDSVLAELAAKAPDGRITKQAIEAYVGKAPATQQSAPQKSEGSSGPEFDATPCSAIRMRIADNMVLSKTKIPHAHNGVPVDVTHIVQYREANKDSFRKKHGMSLNVLGLIFPALVAAIKKFPLVNASYDDTTNPHRIKTYKTINLGIAAGTEHGLVIPVVHGIEKLGTIDFIKTVADKIDKAQKQKLAPADLMGATCLFNNYGFFGTNLGIQIIQYPLATTLGMSAIEERVVAKDGKPAIRHMCDFVLSFDHRVMDGRETGMFLAELKKQIETAPLNVA